MIVKPLAAADPPHSPYHYVYVPACGERGRKGADLGLERALTCQIPYYYVYLPDCVCVCVFRAWETDA